MDKDDIPFWVLSQPNINGFCFNIGHFVGNRIRPITSIMVGPKSPKSPNAEGSGSDQNPDRKAREPSPDRNNNSTDGRGRQLHASFRAVPTPQSTFVRLRHKQEGWHGMCSDSLYQHT